MNIFTYAISRIRNRKSRRKKVALATEQSDDSAAVAKSVLVFLSMGLTDGVETLQQNYTPGSKVKEFVTVSGEILGSLKREYENRFANDSVTMSMKVNSKQKQIELTQLGRNVMLSLDNCATVINNMTLMQLYANMRNDIIKHAEVYGRDLELTALSAPEPNLKPS